MSDLYLNYLLFLIPALVIGYIADLIIGDPHGIWHPICFIGKMITLFERELRRIFSCSAADPSADGSLTDAGEKDTEGALENASEKDTDGSLADAGEKDTEGALENASEKDTDGSLADAGEKDTDRALADAGESDVDRALADAGEKDIDGALENVGERDTEGTLENAGVTDGNRASEEMEKSAGKSFPGSQGNPDICFTERTWSFSNREFIAGIFLVILVLFCTIALTALILMIGYRIHWAVGLILQSYMSYTILATKSLRVESMKVYTALKKEGLAAGRQAVSMIVGRDTEYLDETGVTKAAVETVAENTSDGVIAPLIFLVIGGPILGYFYKAVNTMDSMIGYKNERYRHFGTAAARLDDVLNYLPARISAVLMIAAAALLSIGERRGRRLKFGDEKTNYSFRDETVAEHRQDFYLDVNNACKIWRRDRRKHASPNSAQTESVMAGALGIQLAGDAWYFGVKHEKQTIGDALRPVETEDIVRANRLMYATSILAVLLFLFARWILMEAFCGFF